VSFKASSVASDPQLKIDVLAYVSGKELDFPGTVALVDDTAWSLTSESPSRTILTGSGSNAPGSLPDATTLEVGREFVIVNAGTNFVPIKNHGTASSVFEFLKRTETLTATCTDTSTAAGVWNIVRSGSKVFSADIESDLFEASASVGFISAVANGGSIGYEGAGYSNKTALGVYGSHRLLTGTNSNGASTMHIQYVGTGAALFRGRVLLSAVPTAAEDFELEIGFFASRTTIEAVSGVFVRCPSFDSGLTDWTGTTVTGGTGAVASSVALSAAAVADAVTVLSSNRSRADFWVNKTYVGKLTTNIPSESTVIAPGVKLVKTVGTTGVIVYVDYVRFAMDTVEMRP
jgi:hypothetical protein